MWRVCQISTANTAAHVFVPHCQNTLYKEIITEWVNFVILVVKQKQMMPAHQMVQATHRTLPRGRPSTSPLRSVDPLLIGLSTQRPAVWARRNCILSGVACSAGELRQRTTWTVCPPPGPSDTYGIFLSRCEVLPRPLPFTRKQKKQSLFSTSVAEAVLFLSTLQYRLLFMRLHVVPFTVLY